MVLKWIVPIVIFCIVLAFSVSRLDSVKSPQTKPKHGVYATHLEHGSVGSVKVEALSAGSAERVSQQQGGLVGSIHHLSQSGAGIAKQFSGQNEHYQSAMRAVKGASESTSSYYQRTKQWIVTQWDKLWGSDQKK